MTIHKEQKWVVDTTVGGKQKIPENIVTAGKQKMLRECSGLLESKNDQTTQQLPERKKKGS